MRLCGPTSRVARRYSHHRKRLTGHRQEEEGEQKAPANNLSNPGVRRANEDKKQWRNDRRQTEGIPPADNTPGIRDCNNSEALVHPNQHVQAD